MDKHYYLIAQLPALFFGKETYMTIAVFLQEAERWLNRKEYALLSRVDLDDTRFLADDPQTLRDYKQLEFSLRSELALWRNARRLGQEYRPTSFPLSLFEEGNPLEIEIRLLRLRWDFLEEQEVGHHFDFDLLVLYYLKLQILRRLATFDKIKGLEVFKQLCEVKV